MNTLTKLTDHFMNRASQMHAYFATAIWPQNSTAVKIKVGTSLVTPAYHTDNHIYTTTKAVDEIVHACSTLDPLGINEDLKIWNSKHPAISLERFHQLLKLSFAFHDLGNLTDDSLAPFIKVEDIIYADRYHLETENAERRSIAIAKILLEQYDPSNKIVSPDDFTLIEHVIWQTVFRPAIKSSSEPFWILVQIVDQIASHFYSLVPYKQTTAGYLNELYVANDTSERTPMSLALYLSFAPKRFEALLPDTDKQQKLLSILDPDKTKRKIIFHKTTAPDRPIDYKKDICDIYNGKYSSN